MYIKAMQGHSGDAVQPNFFTQQILGKRCAKELYHIGYSKFEDFIRQGGLVPGGFFTQTQQTKWDEKTDT